MYSCTLWTREALWVTHGEIMQEWRGVRQIWTWGGSTEPELQVRHGWYTLAIFTTEFFTLHTERELTLAKRPTGDRPGFIGLTCILSNGRLKVVASGTGQIDNRVDQEDVTAEDDPGSNVRCRARIPCRKEQEKGAKKHTAISPSLPDIMPWNPLNKYIHIFEISDGTGTYFRGPYLLSGVQ